MSESFIQTERLNLLRPGTDDTTFVRTMLTTRQLSGHPGSLPDKLSAQQIVDGILNDWHIYSCGTCIIQLRESPHTYIGLGGLKPAKSENEVIYDLGMMLLVKHQNTGLGSEALQAFLHHAFAELKLDRVVANTTKDNLSALHLLHKFNFSQPRSFSTAHSQPPENKLWELTKTRYEGTHSV